MKKVVVTDKFYVAVEALVYLLETQGEMSKGVSDLTSYLRKEIDAKNGAAQRRMLYSIYKTSESSIEREVARKMYLDEAGVHPDFRS